MHVCEPYTIHQSKPTDDVVYDSQEPTVVYNNQEPTVVYEAVQS